MPAYIWHVTLNTGHVAKQRRGSVSTQAREVIADTLDAVLLGGHPAIPGFDDYLLNGQASGHDLIATIWRGPWRTRVPILTTATALKSRSAKDFWWMMHEQSTIPLETDPTDPPRTPWQADRVEPTAALHQDALEWTGDFSRSLAWAWLDYRRS